MATRRLISVFLALVAVAVAGHFIVFPLYAYNAAGEASALSRNIWLTLDAFQAAALLLVLITGYQAKQASDGETSAITRSWVTSNLIFYTTVLVAIPFFANWFAALGSTDDNLLWSYLDTAGPVIVAVQAGRLWRSTAA